LSIRIFYDNTSFRLKGWKKTRAVIEKIIRSTDKIAGIISFIITDDESLLKINIEFLNHNYYTDVITFESNDKDIINGEVYISIDTVKLNSGLYKTGIEKELRRVMIHGVLHLLGYNDNDRDEKIKIHAMEDLWLKENEI
jgi:probable rRNA maturation factor